MLEAGAKVLLDEKSLWPNGEFVTTNIIAAQPFLNKYPGTVRSILQANNSAIKYIASNVTKSKDVVQAQITKWVGRPLPDAVITRSWGNLKFTWNPLPKTLAKSADDAVNAGLLTLGKNKLGRHLRPAAAEPGAQGRQRQARHRRRPRPAVARHVFRTAPPTRRQT